MERYFGTYHDFEVPSKKDAGVLLGADNMVGDVYDVVCEMAEGCHTAWLVNRFDQRIGFFDHDFSRKMSLFAAQGMALRAVLSFVAFTDHPDDGRYWGQMAVMCYAPAYAEAFERFVQAIADKMASGARPRVDFDAAAVERIIESGGNWVPEQTVPMPDKAKGTAILKRRRKATDKLVAQARTGNKGCYVASWVFLLTAVAAAAFGLKSCFF